MNFFGRKKRPEEILKKETIPDIRREFINGEWREVRHYSENERLVPMSYANKEAVKIFAELMKTEKENLRQKREILAEKSSKLSFKLGEKEQRLREKISKELDSKYQQKENILRMEIFDKSMKPFFDKEKEKLMELNETIEGKKDKLRSLEKALESKSEEKEQKEKSLRELEEIIDQLNNNEITLNLPTESFSNFMIIRGVPFARHEKLIEFGEKILREKGYHGIQKEYTWQCGKKSFFRIDIIGLKDNERIAVECGTCPFPKIEILCKNFDKVIWIPYSTTRPLEEHQKR